MKQINDKSFFEADTITLAKNLIGKWIKTNTNGKEAIAQISETESYLGINDSACHTYKGKRTAKNEAMWNDGGTIYVYLCYGLHNMLNIVSCKKGVPEAVLIRALKEANGPGKATKYLNIDISVNGQSIINNSTICILDDGKKYTFTKQKRVGIDYALEKDKNALLRFVIKN